MPVSNQAQVIHQSSGDTGAKQSVDGWQIRDWQLLAVLFLIGTIMFVPGLNCFGILDPSDGYYTEGAREMLQMGNYITPHLNYLPWFEKPILIYWLIIACYKIFGVSEFAARVPSALSSIALIGWSYFWVRNFASRRAAFLSAIILATSPLLLITGHLALTDVPLCLCLWLALGSVLIALTRQRRRVFYCLFGGLCLGLALLCKGPIALILLALNTGAYLFAVNKDPNQIIAEICKPMHLCLLLIALAVAAPWYAVETISTHGKFFQEFFVRQNVGRALGAVTHQEPLWYYLPYLAVGFAPWWLSFLAAPKYLSSIWQQRYDRTASNRLALFCLLSAAIIVAAFTFASSKMPTYILPALPALCVLAGLLIDRLMEQRKVAPRFVWAFAGSLMVLFAVATPIAFTAFYNHEWKGFHQLLEKCNQSPNSLVIVGRFAPSANFYTHRQLPMIRNKTAFTDFIKGANSDKLLLISKQRMNYLSLIPNEHQVIEQRGKWSLVLVKQDSINIAAEPPLTDEMLLPGSSTKVGD